MGRTPVICEDGLTSENLGESSHCNSVVNKSTIAHLISNEYLEHFAENEPRNPTPEERNNESSFIRDYSRMD